MRVVPCVICCVLLALLITAGALIPFLVRTPSVKFDGLSVQCHNQTDCLNQLNGDGVMVTAHIVVDNPNILGCDVSSDQVVISSKVNHQRITSAPLAKQSINARGATNISIPFIFTFNNQSIDLFRTLYLLQEPYAIHIDSQLRLSVGAIGYNYHLERETTIPVQH